MKRLSRRYWVGVAAVTGLGFAMGSEAATPVFTGGPVFDPMRYAETTAKAALALEQVRQTAAKLTELGGYREVFSTYRDLRRDFRATRTAFENLDARRAKRALESMPSGEAQRMTRSSTPESALAADILVAATDAHGALRQLRDFYAQFQDGASRAGMDVRQFLAFERERLQRHRAADRRFYQDVTTTIATLRRDVETFAAARLGIAELPQSDDVTRLRAVMESATIHLHNLAGQNSQLQILVGQHLLLGSATRMAEGAAAEQLAGVQRVSLQGQYHAGRAEFARRCQQVATTYAIGPSRCDAPRSGLPLAAVSAFDAGRHTAWKP
jgi:hypothetical protein